MGCLDIEQRARREHKVKVGLFKGQLLLRAIVSGALWAKAATDPRQERVQERADRREQTSRRGGKRMAQDAEERQKGRIRIESG